MSEQTRPLPEEHRFFGGIGLARMAAMLANERAGDPEGCYLADEDFIGPCKRSFAKDNPLSVPASAEYYAIIDRITRGEKP